MMPPKISDPTVQAAYDAMLPDVLVGIYQLRRLIFDCAKTSPDVGEVKEVLRWGQPSFITKTGSTLRLGIPKTGGFALYAHCQSTIISDFALMFAEEFDIEGNRAVHFHSLKDIDEDKLCHLINHALRYKIKKTSTY